MPDNRYTPALADTICKRNSEGESLRAICRDPDMPSEGTVDLPRFSGEALAHLAACFSN